jgi:hypothetical protein
MKFVFWIFILIFFISKSRCINDQNHGQERNGIENKQECAHLCSLQGESFENDSGRIKTRDTTNLRAHASIAYSLAQTTKQRGLISRIFGFLHSPWNIQISMKASEMSQILDEFDTYASFETIYSRIRFSRSELFVLATILSLVGSYLCLFGDLYQIPFLIFVGAVTGSTISIRLCDVANRLDMLPDRNIKWWIYLVALLVSVACIALCLYYSSAKGIMISGTGFYYAASVILAPEYMGSLLGSVGRDNILFCSLVLGLFLCWISEQLAVIIGAAITGAIAISIGIDCVLETGFIADFYYIAFEHFREIPSHKPGSAYIYIIFLGLIALGITLKHLFIIPFERKRRNRTENIQPLKIYV